MKQASCRGVFGRLCPLRTIPSFRFDEVFQGVTHPGRYPVKMRLHRLKIGHERRTLFAPVMGTIQHENRVSTEHMHP